MKDHQDSGTLADFPWPRHSLRYSQLPTADSQMCSVYSAVSGEEMCVVDDEGKTVKEVKEFLATQIGVSRFRQRFWSEDWSHEMQDDEVFAAMKVHLIVLNLLPPEDEESQRMIAASMDNDVAALEALLQGPRNVMDEDGHAPLKSCR